MNSYNNDIALFQTVLFSKLFYIIASYASDLGTGSWMSRNAATTVVGVKTSQLSENEHAPVLTSSVC